MRKSSSDCFTSGLGRVLAEELVLLEDRVDGRRREGGDLVDDGLTRPQVPRVPIDLMGQFHSLCLWRLYQRARFFNRKKYFRTYQYSNYLRNETY